ncbi:MAG TPA: hypothetical protein VLU94_02045 [Candidatus Nitrosotalea sp.]|nr:hypothetical protein [Candidatus Nitrosotalea sp.]
MLEIRFEFIDGSKEIFVQTGPEQGEIIEGRVNGSNLFSHARIVVADDYSKSVFVCSQINRVDLVGNSSGFRGIPPDHSDLVELTESDFRRHVPLDNPSRLQKREQPRQVGDLLVSFLHLRMRGASHVYLMNEALIKVPAENQSYMQRLLSKGIFRIRLPRGGQGFLNLQNLIGYTVYPGAAEIPADSWIAQPKRAP